MGIKESAEFTRYKREVLEMSEADEAKYKAMEPEERVVARIIAAVRQYESAIVGMTDMPPATEILARTFLHQMERHDRYIEQIKNGEIE